MNIPAFPSKDEGGYYDGMTLRDWFAGQALAGRLANGSDRLSTGSQRQSVAEEAYAYADFMLKARGA
jgi:hypothetical protein